MDFEFVSGFEIRASDLSIMVDLIVYLKQNLSEHFFLYFVPLYIVGGRPVAIISAQMLGFGAAFLLPVVVLMDTLQVPLFFLVFDTVSNRPFVKKMRERWQQKEKKLTETKFFQRMQVAGIPGVLAITILPLKGCGMLSGFILSRILRLTKPVSYIFLIAGSIIGCVLLLGAGEGLLRLIRSF